MLLYLPWILLTVATAAGLFSPRLGLWTALTALAAGTLSGVVAPWYAAMIVAIGLVLWFTQRLPRAAVIAVHISFGLFVLAAAMHWIPGTESLVLVRDCQKSADSSLYTLGVRFDKTLVSLGLLILLPSMVARKSEPARMGQLLITVIGGILSVLLLAWALGGIRPAFGVPWWTGLFIIKMMAFTCFAEEVIFRGYLQTLITDRWGAAVGIGGAAVLFGLAHGGGGVVYAILASIAGVVYGLSYNLTGRLWVPILVHTALNSAHLIFFTYPTYAG